MAVGAVLPAEWRVGARRREGNAGEAGWTRRRSSAIPRLEVRTPGREVVMFRYALVAWLLTAPLAPAAAPPRAGETAWPHFEYVPAVRVNFLSSPRPHSHWGGWENPVFIGTTAAGEAAVIDW